MHHQEPSRFRRLFAIAFLLVTALGLLVSARAIVSREARGPGSPLAAVLDGRWASSFQSGFEEALPFRDAAVVLWTAARYALFRSGGPGVVVGEDGWLFTAEEFETHPDYQERLIGRLRRVAAVRAALEAKGIDLIVALVPSKARLHPQKLRGHYLPRRPPSVLADRYSHALDYLRNAGIPAPDLRPVLASEDRFFRRDTHWTPRGAGGAARALAAPGRQALDRKMVGRSAFQSIAAGTISHTGDLMTFLPLGPLAERFGLGPEEVRLFETRRAQTAGAGSQGGSGSEDGDPLGLFDTPTIPVALVGTSYSADPRWNFGGFLQEALEAEVLTIAEEGKGPFEPMEAYLASDTIAEIPPGLVIWEIPERYLTVDAE